MPARRRPDLPRAAPSPHPLHLAPPDPEGGNSAQAPEQVGVLLATGELRACRPDPREPGVRSALKDAQVAGEQLGRQPDLNGTFVRRIGSESPGVAAQLRDLTAVHGDDGRHTQTTARLQAWVDSPAGRFARTAKALYWQQT